MQSVGETTGTFMLGKELDILMAERKRLLSRWDAEIGAK